MKALHGVLEAVTGVGVRGVGLAVVKEEREEEERSVLVNGDVVDMGESAEWVPSVWAKGGVGTAAWLLLAAVLGICLLAIGLGWRWYRKTTKDLKAAEAV